MFNHEKEYILVASMELLFDFTDLGDRKYRCISLSIGWFLKWIMELHAASNTVGGSERAVRQSIAVNTGLSGGWLVLLSRVHAAGPRLNIKTVLSTYGDFHVKDKTAVRTSYL